jgi:hypothetical protein
MIYVRFGFGSLHFSAVTKLTTIHRRENIALISQLAATGVDSAMNDLCSACLDYLASHQL